MSRFKGASAVVTGASRGLGLAIATLLAERGARLVICGRDGETLNKAAWRLRDLGAEVHPVRCDLAEGDAAQKLVAEAVHLYGGLDLLVNNAGIENKVPTLRLSLDDWNRVLRTNLTGAFLCMRAAGQVMAKNGGGVIVNMSSVHEHIPWPEFAHYCASKGGMKLLMQTVAREWAPLKIRVVNIAPGAIVTPINQFVISDPEAEHAVEAEIPLGRLGQPEEIAAAVAWVASDEASYLTGATIIVDGGMTLYPQFV